MALTRTEVLDRAVADVLPHVDLHALDGQRLFLTGGTGFFGLWLLSVMRFLHRRSAAPAVCVLSRNPEAFLARHPQFRREPWLRFVTGDIRDFPMPSDPFDLVLHGAAETSLAAHADPLRMFDDIVFGTRHLLAFAERCAASRILLVSSGAVYGDQPESVEHQPDDSRIACDPLAHGSAYGEGKRVMELLAAIHQRRTDTACVIARCFAFSGPGLPLDGHFAVGNFVRDALFADRIVVQGDGRAIRSYLHGADLALWLLHLLLHGTPGTAYNVGSDAALSIEELARCVHQVLAPDKPVAIRGGVVAASQTRHRYVPSIARARALGCAPWTTLEDSLRQSAAYWQAASP